MSFVETTGFPRQLLSIDVGWRNVTFSLRTAAAAVAALAIAYWLEISAPQWATLTVYILAQPTVGAALAKGSWRAAGTVAGGIFGLVLVAAFSQAPEMLVAATALTVGVSFYAGARLRNMASYGVLLAGYTALLVAYEGSSDPLNAWSVAADRITAILIGIVCGTAASVIFFPRYASDELNAALSRTFSGLVHYTATALRLSSPLDVFARLRQRMTAEVISFDALRSYSMFEMPETRANEQRLRRLVREFLIVLSIGRGLFVRLDAFDKQGAQFVKDELMTPLEGIAARIEQIAGTSSIPASSVLRDPRQLHEDLMAARTSLNDIATRLDSMVGAAPFDVLADARLIVDRVGDILNGLAMVVVTEAASLGGGAADLQHHDSQADHQQRREAFLIAVRASVAMALLSIVWMATGWSEGFTVVSGGAIMLFFGINQDHPQIGARTYLIWSTIGTALGYLVMILAMPHLQGFSQLAAVLVLVLLPAGLMAGTPSHAWAGIAFGGFTIAQVSTGNSFVPDEMSYINSAAALVLGMLICLAVIAAMPVTSHAQREESWQRALGTILPAVARGKTLARQGSVAIVDMLAALLPRLTLDRSRDEAFFRGTLGAASSAIELGRLSDLKSDPAMPKDIAQAIDNFLEQFALRLEGLADSGADRERRIKEVEASVNDIRAALSAHALKPGETARVMLRAGASLRFIADRFDIDRAYFENRFLEIES